MATELPPSDNRPESRLIRKVNLICGRVIRGRHAVDRWQVQLHRALRITSIVLSSLGGVGLIANNAGATSGWTVSLVFGILLQIANELGIERIANQARSALTASSFMQTQLDIVLASDDPTGAVNKLLEETNTVLRTYHEVLPELSPLLEAEAARLAAKFVDTYGGDWQLPARQRRRKEPPGPGADSPRAPEPPEGPEGDPSSASDEGGTSRE